jgi:hypothetical protein
MFPRICEIFRRIAAKIASDRWNSGLAQGLHPDTATWRCLGSAQANSAQRDSTMAKANVNTASRDELVEAGVRAELADEILKLRRKGKISLEALDQVPGVGPATLEQLRKSLDFSDKSGNGGEPAREPEQRSRREEPERTVEATREGGRRSEEMAARTSEAAHSSMRVGTEVARESGHRLEEAAERTSEAARSAVRGGAEVARTAVSAGAEAASNAARSGLKVVERATSSVSEAQRQVTQQSTESASELVQVFVDLTSEQSRQNLLMLTRLTQVVRWDQLLEAQSAFLHASLERLATFNRRYLEITQGMLRLASAAARDRHDRAA